MRKQANVPNDWLEINALTQNLNHAGAALTSTLCS